MRISQEDSGIGFVMHRAPIQENLIALAID
jgi:hypothetical protein